MAKVAGKGRGKAAGVSSGSKAAGAASRGQATRARIVRSAGELFASRGYEATSIEAVLEKSGVSRGALYHHFHDKEELFVAVLEAVEARIADATVKASRGIADPVGALLAGCNAWLDISRDPVIRQIVMIDAPAVVGWQKWREIDARYGFGLLKGSLRAAAEAGRLSPALVEPLAHVLLAAVLEIALLMARADDAPGSVKQAKAALRELIEKLLGPGGKSTRGRKAV